MSHSDEYRRPAMSRFVLEYLGVAPGPVDDLLIVRNMFCHNPGGIYVVQHVLRSLVPSSMKY
jgi:hypothetical protein